MGRIKPLQLYKLCALGGLGMYYSDPPPPPASRQQVSGQVRDCPHAAMTSAQYLRQTGI